MSPDPENAVKNPSYRQVCSGTTGHVEVLYVELEPSDNLETVYRDLVRFFFQFHDPTTPNRQGNDAGPQYASALFCADENQRKIAQQVKEDLQAQLNQGFKSGYAAKTVETGIFDLSEFFPAHEEHQQYLEKTPNGYCNHFMRFKEWPPSPQNEL